MKIIQKNWYLFIMFSICLSREVLPLTERYFHAEDLGYEYSRGTYLIVLADASLEIILEDESTGNFIHFKKTQGYNVDIITMAEVGGTAENLRSYLQYYYESDPMLEYVLLIGDINGSYALPSFTIPSYNESDLDVTDYPYSFFDNADILNPSFFIGRWSIRSQDDLKKIKMRSIQYIKMDYLSDHSFLNNALLVAGNYSDSGTWPVTPVWTSKWLMDELRHFGYNTIDTAFFHLDNQQVNNSLISSAWNNGVGIINYRGWGDANGWHYPHFHRDDIDPGLNNGLHLPIVFSFVCNTGDFGNDFNGSGLDKCFGEILTTGGSINSPKGAAAMIGPSDLDTDTRFNNVLCAVMWDEFLEGRIPELAPALHAGKQALSNEFGNLEVNGTNITQFYHHVYGVLGDPSLPVWLEKPSVLYSEIEYTPTLTASSISTKITDSDGAVIQDVVGALIYQGALIGKGLSNHEGIINISFNVPIGSDMILYLNKPQFYQKSINLTYLSGDTEDYVHSYSIEMSEPNYIYQVVDSDSQSDLYDWIEINHKGINLNLNDDSIIKDIELGFDFRYYGEIFSSLTICSNGWVSFLPCLDKDGDDSSCNPIPHFFNNSIPHPLGPYGMLAPFFDDLDDNNGSEDFDVYFWSNRQDSVIVEWDNVANGQTDENCPNCEKETFQVILNNTDIISPSDGNIIFQYKEIHDIDDHGTTIGIESPDKNSGVEYLFNYQYADDVVGPINNSFAIKFIPQCASNIEADQCGVCGGDGYPSSWYFDSDEDGLGDPDNTVEACIRPANYVNNYDDIDDACKCDSNNALCYDCDGVCGGNLVVDQCGVCGGDSSTCISGCTDPNASNYNPDAIIDDGSCMLAINEAVIPQRFSLETYPNPFNPVVRVSFAIPEMRLASVKVLDIRGLELAVLSNQNYELGYYSVNWNASSYSSGVYFITLTASDKKLTRKVLLLK